MATIGLLFDIDELGGGFYGHAAYKIFFDAIDPVDLRGCTIWDGDTQETLTGKSRQFCIAVGFSGTSETSKIKDTLSSLRAKGLLPPSLRFLDDAAVLRQPLAFICRVSLAGELMDVKSAWIVGTMEGCRKERQRLTAVDMCPIRSTGEDSSRYTHQPACRTSSENQSGNQRNVNPERARSQIASALPRNLYKFCIKCGNVLGPRCQRCCEDYEPLAISTSRLTRETVFYDLSGRVLDEDELNCICSPSALENKAIIVASNDLDVPKRNTPENNSNQTRTPSIPGIFVAALVMLVGWVEIILESGEQIFRESLHGLPIGWMDILELRVPGFIEFLHVLPFMAAGVSLGLRSLVCVSVQTAIGYLQVLKGFGKGLASLLGGFLLARFPQLAL